MIPADAIDWRVLKREGDAYLRRLGLSDESAVWCAATLYVREYNEYRRGKTWNARRYRWETRRCRERKYQTCLGVSFSAGWRAKLAKAWAESHGESEARWTPELERDLLAFRAQGHSYNEIAKEMGKTKAAVQARVRYLALGRRLKAAGPDEVGEQGIAEGDEPHTHTPNPQGAR